VGEGAEIIKGIGEVYARTWWERAGIDTVETLLEAGVDTAKELRHRVPEHLHQRMIEVNEEKKLVRWVAALS